MESYLIIGNDPETLEVSIKEPIVEIQCFILTALWTYFIYIPYTATKLFGNQLFVNGQAWIGNSRWYCGDW